MEPVASGDKVARQLSRLAVFAVANLRRGSVEVVDAHVAGLEHNLTSGCEPRRDQILDDFVLRVDCNRAASGQPAQIDTMAAAAEAQLEAVMGQSDPLQPLADSRFNHQVDGALLEQAGANPLLHISPTASLEHDRLDPRQVQQVRQHQARRARADNADLCAQLHLSCKRLLVLIRNI